jgi:hypothetical protein
MIYVIPAVGLFALCFLGVVLLVIFEPSGLPPDTPEQAEEPNK